MRELEPSSSLPGEQGRDAPAGLFGKGSAARHCRDKPGQKWCLPFLHRRFPCNHLVIPVHPTPQASLSVPPSRRTALEQCQHRKATRFILEMLKRLVVLLICSSTSTRPKLVAKFSLSCLAVLVLPHVSGKLICQVSGKTPSLPPLVTSCFQEYTSSLSLVSCDLFWEKLPSFTSM